MFNFKPKQDEFFVLFAQSSELVLQAASVLNGAMKDYTLIGEKMTQISNLEHEADELNDKIIDKLNQTFITPMDREDIYSLATMLDDAVDLVQGIIERMLLYRTGQPSNGAAELSDVLLRCAKELMSAFQLLKNIQGNHHEILEHTKNVVQLESKGDSIYRQEVAHLFTSCSDPMEVIKWKEVLEYLESAIDHCEAIADVMRGVVLKYA